MSYLWCLTGQAPRRRRANYGVEALKLFSAAASHPQAAVLNLNHPGHYLHWGVFQISLANLIVVLAMVGVFVLALVLPFPGHGDRS